MAERQILHPPWDSITGMLAAQFSERAASTAIIDGTVVLSYRDLERLSRILATRMCTAGLEPGDRVAIWAENSWQWVVAVMACWWAGCIVVPLSSRSKFLDLLPVIEQTRPRLIFLSCLGARERDSCRFISYLLGRQPHTASSLSSLPLISTFEELTDERLPSCRYIQFPSPACSLDRPVGAAASQADDVCEIIYTSGSSGLPKGVPRRHAEVLGNRWASSVSRGFCSEDVLLALPDFAHTLGLNGVLLRSAMLGATLVICSQHNVLQRADLIRQRRVSVLIGPPSLFDSLLMAGPAGVAALSGIRLASVGSSAIRPELITRLLDAGVKSVASGYGMTECDSISSAVQTMGIEVVANTVGKPEFGIEIEIANEDGDPVAPGETGEILVKGYCVSKGYYQDESLSAESFTAEGWLKTGDLGRWTSGNYLQIRGRKKDVIIIHGYTVYPAEVERLLMLSGMLESVSVVGVPRRFSGQESIAFVRPAADKKFDLRALRLWAKENIAIYKVPTRIVALADLPLTKSGKIDKGALIRSFNSGDQY